MSNFIINSRQVQLECSNAGKPRPNKGMMKQRKIAPQGCYCPVRISISCGRPAKAGHAIVRIAQPFDHNAACCQRNAAPKTRSKEAKHCLLWLVGTYIGMDTAGIIQEYEKLYAKAQMDEKNLTFGQVQQMWIDNPDSKPIDAWVTYDDVRYARDCVTSTTYKRHPDDATSVHLMAMGALAEGERVLQYQAADPEAGKPFLLVIAHDDLLARFKSIPNAVLMWDDTYGTNKYKYPLSTIMVIDRITGRGIPVGWAIHASDSVDTYRQILDSFADACGAGFHPAVVSVDGCPKERQAFQASKWHKEGAEMALCFFHLKRSWVDKMIELMPFSADVPLRKQIMEELHGVICSSSVESARRRMDAFMAKWSDMETAEGAAAVNFIGYFEEEYANRLEEWAFALRAEKLGVTVADLKALKATTNNSLEAYHKVLKEIGLEPGARLCSKRLDWLVYRLFKFVVCKYRHDISTQQRTNKLERHWLWPTLPSEAAQLGATSVEQGMLPEADGEGGMVVSGAGESAAAGDGALLVASHAASEGDDIADVAPTASQHGGAQEVTAAEVDKVREQFDAQCTAFKSAADRAGEEGDRLAGAF